MIHGLSRDILDLLISTMVKQQLENWLKKMEKIFILPRVLLHECPIANVGADQARPSQTWWVQYESKEGSMTD